MSKPDFNQVIKELRTDLVVLVDDDFMPVEIGGEMLYHFLCINNIDYELVLTKLQVISAGLADALTELRPGFLAVDFTPADVEWFKAGEIVTCFNRCEQPGLSRLAETFLALVEDFQEDVSILAMNTGLAPVSGAAVYQPFIDILNDYKPRKSVKIYRQLKGEAFNEFEADLSFTLERLPHKYFLFIVDKILGGGDNGSDLINDLRDRNNGIDTFFSILFTSQAAAAKNPDIRVQDYLHFEVQKPAQESAANAVELVAGGLAICAYATFFDKIFDLKMKALKTANTLVVESGQANMLYLAEMAKAEGTTVFRTIDQWFDLLVQKKIYDSLISPAGNTLDYQFITGLTNLINETYLPSQEKPLGGEFRQELQELSNFELFNNAVNQLHYPPAPGDIYQLGEQDIYILTGQDCDLIVREDGKSVSRKERLAELVQCRFTPKPLDDKKTDSPFGLSLNYFCFNGQYGTLEIEFNKRCTIDFRILDLCSLRPDGLAQFQAGGNLTDAAARSLPVMWQRYYPKLVEELEGKLKVQKFLAAENISREILSADISYNLSFTEADDTITFPAKRLTRLKGQFKDYFLQRYWEHKTRKGLNTISLYNRKPISGTVYCGFHDNMEEITRDCAAWLQLTGNREKNRKMEKLHLVLHKAGLGDLIPERHQALFGKIKSEEIILIKPEQEENQIIFKKRWEEGIPHVEICFPFYNAITKKHFKGKDALSLGELFQFTPGQLAPGSQYQVAGNEEMRDIFNGNKHNKILLEDWALGIIIPALDWHIKLDRDSGRLDYVQQQATIIDEQS